MKSIFYLDLDRTLFRTERVGEFFPVLEQLYPQNTALHDGYALREQYFVFPQHKDGDEKTYYYDVARQLRDAGLDIEQALSALRTELGDGRFEHEGVRDFVRALQVHGVVKILTYGEDIYQRFKVSLCPSLAGLEVITTLEPKAKYLNKHSVAGDWVVDDKIIDDLTTGIQTVHIQYDMAKPADVHSLTEATEHIVRSISF